MHGASVSSFFLPRRGVGNLARGCRLPPPPRPAAPRAAVSRAPRSACPARERCRVSGSGLSRRPTSFPGRPGSEPLGGPRETPTSSKGRPPTKRVGGSLSQRGWQTSLARLWLAVRLQGPFSHGSVRLDCQLRSAPWPCSGTVSVKASAGSAWPQLRGLGALGLCGAPARVRGPGGSALECPWRLELDWTVLR